MINSTYVIRPSLLEPGLFYKQISLNLTIIFGKNEDNLERKIMFP